MLYVVIVSDGVVGDRVCRIYSGVPKGSSAWVGLTSLSHLISDVSHPVDQEPAGDPGT